MPFSIHKLTSTNTAPVTRRCQRQPTKLSERMVWGSMQDSRHAPYPLSLGLQAVFRSRAGLGDQLLPTGKACRQMTFNPTFLIVPVSQKSPYKATQDPASTVPHSLLPGHHIWTPLQRPPFYRRTGPRTPPWSPCVELPVSEILRKKIPLKHLQSTSSCSF